MLKTIKFYLTFTIIILSPLLIWAQSSTSSPYSRYGIGDINDKGFGQNKALGGIALGLRSSEHINLTNPASYTSFDSLSFIFDVGVKGKQTTFKSYNAEHTINNVNLSYIAMGFPVTKWWAASIAMVPLSNVGYEINYSENITDIGNVAYKYTGNGGINQALIGSSLRLHKRLSLGINASYLFGSLNHTKKLSIDDVNAYSINTTSKTTINDFYFNLGLQYTNAFKTKYKYTVGLIFDNQSNLKSRNSLLTIKSKGSTAYNDTLENYVKQKGDIVLPYNIGLGITLINDNKLLIGADFYTQNWSNAKFFGTNDSLANSNYIGFGLEYTPERFHVTKYWKRVSYRIGGHSSDTYLQLHNNQLKDYGFSLGLGLPLRKTKTAINISVEVGQRGTTNNNLIKENYAIVSLNLSLHDLWFNKKKFD